MANLAYGCGLNDIVNQPPVLPSAHGLFHTKEFAVEWKLRPFALPQPL